MIVVLVADVTVVRWVILLLVFLLDQCQRLLWVLLLLLCCFLQLMLWQKILIIIFWDTLSNFYSDSGLPLHSWCFCYYYSCYFCCSRCYGQWCNQLRQIETLKSCCYCGSWSDWGFWYSIYCIFCASHFTSIAGMAGAHQISPVNMAAIVIRIKAHCAVGIWLRCCPATYNIAIILK